MLYISGNNIENIVKIMNDELETLYKWLGRNKLNININKS